MEDDIFKLIRAVEVFTNESMIQFTKEFQHNIGISSILVLAELRDKKSLKPSVLADELGYTPGAMTNIANKLIKEDLAVRKYNENDRRMVLLAVTEKGLFVLDEAQQVGQELRKKLFQALNEEEIQQFLAIHEKLVRNIER